jgi:hypothetical protein
MYFLKQKAKFSKGNRTAALDGEMYEAALPRVCSKVSKVMSSQTARIQGSSK